MQKNVMFRMMNVLVKLSSFINADTIRTFETEIL